MGSGARFAWHLRSASSSQAGSAVSLVVLDLPPAWAPQPEFEPTPPDWSTPAPFAIAARHFPPDSPPSSSAPPPAEPAPPPVAKHSLKPVHYVLLLNHIFSSTWTMNPRFTIPQAL